MGLRSVWRTRRRRPRLGSDERGLVRDDRGRGRRQAAIACPWGVRRRPAGHWIKPPGGHPPGVVAADFRLPWGQPSVLMEVMGDLNVNGH